MRPTFHPRLVNGPFEDPALFIPFANQKRALLFDLGDLHALSTRDLLKVSHVFVTHTHMDHFIGFDRLIRVLLGREKTIALYGPRGFIHNVASKLAGYSWNLVNHYQHHLLLQVTEVHRDCIVTQSFSCKDRFMATGDPRKNCFDGILLDEAAIKVSAVIMDHSIPCLGFALSERYHVNIRKDALQKMGLPVGPWLRDFKLSLYEQQDPATQIVVTTSKARLPVRQIPLKDLKDRIAIKTPGQKVAYVTDVAYSPENRFKIVDLARKADYLFIEAAFLEEDLQIATKKYHLTARQAGLLAAETRARQFTIFHFSPRYAGREKLLQQEALAAYHSHGFIQK